jgi:hypothetical protein
MAVDPVDHPGIAVAEDLGKHPRVGAGGDKEGRGRVAQVVWSEGSELGGADGPGEVTPSPVPGL